MFNGTDRRDVGYLIDKCPNASTSYFEIKVLHLCVRTADKYSTVQAGARKMSIMAKNAALIVRIGLRERGEKGVTPGRVNILVVRVHDKYDGTVKTELVEIMLVRGLY